MEKPNAMAGTSSVASINVNEPDNEPHLSLEQASLVCKEEATNLHLETSAADVHILIELDLSSSSSFAFFVHIGPSPTSLSLQTSTTLESLHWSCTDTPFYGKRRARLFSENVNSQLLPSLTEIKSNLNNGTYTIDTMPIPPLVYELQEALRTRPYIALRTVSQKKVKKLEGFSQADILTFCYLSFVVVVAGEGTRLRLVEEVPRVMEWWRRIQGVIGEALKGEKIAEEFRCFHGGINPLNVEETCGWLDGEVIKATFERNFVSSGEFVGVQSRPPVAGKIKRKNKSKILNETKGGDGGRTPKETIDAVIEKLEAMEVKSSLKVDEEIPDLIDPVPWSTLPVHLNPETYISGKMSSVPKRLKKRQQISNMLSQILSLLPPPSSNHPLTAVDFCCGSGHVGIVLAYLRPDITVTFLDCNPVALAHAKTRSSQLNLKNSTFLKLDVRAYDVLEMPFDVGFALHACGGASDYVLSKCLEAKAGYVMCPCCVGFIQNVDEGGIKLPGSIKFKKAGVGEDTFRKICRLADHTSEGGEEGQVAMRLVNEDRNWRAKERGYETKHWEMRPKECTPKRAMIVGKFICEEIKS
ncbi:hypothetical protein TrVE_jg288 [Triparma verrucosa]|uniref:Methyltransferase domain-containing protein n=1 Tax=Triparma verrucosa TaxID=1606542 RepID=A0A9W7CE41_9STRA|nr:hypothetical protein TrVE_jg288 [Triparma verrucosa]